jgi:MFS transporter, MCT family, solute carrier family 16 (monocarboxylic acid transporters), member 10
MGEVGDVGRRTGILFTITSVSALCGPPVSGAIMQRTGGYEAVAYYAGKVFLIGQSLSLSHWIN